MKKNDMMFNYLMIAIIFCAVVGAFVAICFYKVNTTTALLTGGGICALAVLLMVIRNYRFSAYGGRFQNRYPDGTAGMTDQK